MTASSQALDVFLRRDLSGPVLFIGRSLVGLFGLLAIVVYLRSIPGWLQTQAVLGTPAIAAAVLSMVAFIAWITLAVLVFLRRSRDFFGLLLVTGFLSFALVMGTFTQISGLIGEGRTNPWAAPWPATILLIAEGFSLPWAFCFPDGRFVPWWTLPLSGLWLLQWLVPAFGGPFVADSPLGPVVATVLTVSMVGATIPAGVYRYLRRSSPVQRQQIKWAMLGGLVFVVIYLLLVPTGLLIAGERSSQALFFQSLHRAIFSAAVAAIPVALAVGIFRQGLLDIDHILNRTITYAALTVGLAIAFVAISAVANLLLAAVMGKHSEEVVLLASVVPVAIAFMPARARALQLANRYVSESKVMTLLFVDLVGSTERAYALGNRPWRELLERFRATVRRTIKHYGGHEVDTTGDGFFVTFDSPTRAISCGHAIIGAIKPLKLDVRVGVHIGEVQVDGRYVEGANVHLAARVMSEAKAGEVLISEALRDVVAGTEIDLTDRGNHQLKGVPGQVRLYAALG
jgi:class 3 adenylate cyclase